jgi:hypothetical protein
MQYQQVDLDDDSHNDDDVESDEYSFEDNGGVLDKEFVDGNDPVLEQNLFEKDAPLNKD